MVVKHEENTVAWGGAGGGGGGGGAGGRRRGGLQLVVVRGQKKASLQAAVHVVHPHHGRAVPPDATQTAGAQVGHIAGHYQRALWVKRPGSLYIDTSVSVRLVNKPGDHRPTCLLTT